MPATQRELTHTLIQDPVAKQRVMDKAVKAFAKHGTIHRAAQIAKIDRRTLQSWFRNDPIAAAKLKDADDDVTDQIEEKSIKGALDGDAKLLIHLLASRNARYKHKTEVEVTQTLNLDNVVQKMRQIAIAQPTLAPTIRAALQMALEQIP